MAIFGRSKKGKQTTTTLPQTQSAPILNQEPIYQGPYATSPRPNWNYGDQRPHTAGGSGSQQPQGWIIAPLYQPYQLIPYQNNLEPPPVPQWPQKNGGAFSKLNLASVTNLLAGDVPECVPGARIFNEGVPAWQHQGAQYLNQGAALCDLISSKFNTVITLIDGERFSGDERELVVYPPPQPMWQQEQQDSGYTDRDLFRGKSKGVVNNKISTALVSANYFAKVNLYANSRLPPNLPPMKLYVPTPGSNDNN
jgi:hypothetical protein